MLDIRHCNTYYTVREILMHCNKCVLHPAWMLPYKIHNKTIYFPPVSELLNRSQECGSNWS